MKKNLLIVVLLWLGCRDAPSGPGFGSGTGPTATGGAADPASGGTTGSGGRSDSGGTTGSGGRSDSGGTTGSGGAVGTGGQTDTGGTAGAGTGGQTGTGGTTGSGGSTTGATGGSPGTGGSVRTGGNSGTGGITGAGGNTGGAGPDAGRDAMSPADSREAGADTGATGSVTYNGNIKALLQTNCISCHSSGNPSAGIALDSYTNAKNNATLANSMIQSGAMPPTGALSAANKALFQSWVNAGEPQ
jgi:hypothetical protein